ncbi:MAG: 5-methyltetrahydropteroyltriglutamate--homocysteine S-methyltransferase [Alphaproteobacteria bacterium]
MAKADTNRPPFRVDHVGSFLRPQRLLAAAREAKAGEIDAAAYRAIQDDSIRDIVAFQEGLGLRAVTDGEFRRRSWSAGFIDAVEGFGLREGALGFRDESGDLGIASSPYAETRLRRTQPIVAEDYRFLKSVVANSIPKVTMPSPDVMHFFLGPRAVDESVYPDIEVFYDDLAQIYRDEIAMLGANGCTYLQLDNTALACNCDERGRAQVVARGEDPDALTRRYAKLTNAALEGRPEDMFVSMHLCRGNLKGAWMAEGGYEPIAEALFGEANVDTFFLEYDTPRAGDFQPLRFVPANKSVMLGLVSTKTPALESEDELKRRIDEAARFIPLERLGISPQCGFSSGGGRGQPITQDDTKAKIELLQRVARDVWG